jgi:recombination protein RecR
MPLDFNLNQKHGLNFKYQSICESLLLQFKRICRVNRFIVSLRKIRQTMNSPYPSTLLENAVNEFARLPGIGRKSALRLVLHLLRQEEESVTHFTESILRLKREVKYCAYCHNISDTEVCSICANKTRNNGVICVVENIREVMAIEKTAQFNGLYHVLGGIISPIDGIGPSDLEINSLEERVKTGGIREVILALSATMEGDTTNFYIFRKLQPYHVKVSIIARGVSVGNEIEYTDEVTLGRSILNRTPFDESYKLLSR